jgi:hypothetical protein
MSNTHGALVESLVARVVHAQLALATPGQPTHAALVRLGARLDALQERMSTLILAHVRRRALPSIHPVVHACVVTAMLN